MRDKGYEERITSNITAALRTRIGSLLRGWKGKLFDHAFSTPWADLFDRPVIVNLQQMGDDADKCFTMALLLNFMYEYRQAQHESAGSPLLELMAAADSSAESAAAFQNAMSTISKLPGRAKPENRLHRQKGCRFCETPCRYGYFTLVSDPNFKLLQNMLEEENAKAGEEQDRLRAAWAFCAIHLWRTLGIKQGYITPGHLGNLTYCLLMLATAKSRFALPEKQIQMFQAANQRLISGWPG